MVVVRIQLYKYFLFFVNVVRNFFESMKIVWFFGPRDNFRFRHYGTVHGDEYRANRRDVIEKMPIF